MLAREISDSRGLFNLADQEKQEPEGEAKRFKLEIRYNFLMLKVIHYWKKNNYKCDVFS